MTRTKALAKLYKSISGSSTKKVTITDILKELYYSVIGTKTTKNNIADILSEMADNYEGGSGGGGGGGESDFSIATITVTGTGIPVDGLTLCGAFCVTVVNADETSDSLTVGEAYIVQGDNTVDVVLYKGMAYVYASMSTADYSISATGDIDLDTDSLDTMELMISGNGTLTINAAN